MATADDERRVFIALPSDCKTLDYIRAGLPGIEEACMPHLQLPEKEAAERWTQKRQSVGLSTLGYVMTSWRPTGRFTPEGAEIVDDPRIGEPLHHIMRRL